VLLWGDPAIAAGFGRLSGIAGSQGFEWCEPLSLKGREGTGLGGSRDGYADASLSTADDWEKHAYAYRLFGRLSYDPDADPEVWRRPLRASFGPAAASAERALASASRILPLVTTAHHPSASNNYYWPEVYTDLAIVGPPEGVETHYYDTPAPKRFGTVGPLDPEIFSSVEDAVVEVLEGRPSGRVSPMEVATWLEHLSRDASGQLADMERDLIDPSAPEARRLIVDVAIQAALGRFFAGKMRAATLYEVAGRTGDTSLIGEALEAYRAARDAWAAAAEAATGVYVDDLTYGPQPWLRGTWSDRLPAIDRDLGALAAAAAASSVGAEGDDQGRRVLAGLSPASRDAVVAHEPPPPFRPGEPIVVSFGIEDGDSPLVLSARLRYRRLDQSQTYDEVEMTRAGDGFVATIPGEITGSAFPIQYHAVFVDAEGGAWLHPGLGAELSGQPYHVIRQASGGRPGTGRAGSGPGV
jgi:hypothetical protein